MEGSLFFILVLLLFWAGFVSSISFMEAWQKFRVKGVTLTIGLSIGKKIFTSLNRTEWVFLFFYTILGLTLVKVTFDIRTILTLLLFAILFTQTFWLLPALNHSVERILKGETPARSSLHLYFGSLEILKILLLIWLSFLWYRYELLNQ